MNIYYIGAVILGLGAVITLVISRVTLKPYRPIFLLVVIVPTVAATAYALMANSIGFIETASTPVNMTRYIDWIITTPILLYILSYAMVEDRKKRLRTFFLLASLDVLMIVTGFAAELTAGTTKAALFGISSIAYLIMLYVIVDTLLTLNQTRKSATLKRTALGMAWVILILWSAYPFVWIFGTQGTGALSATGEIVSYMFLDVSTKLGFAILLLIYLHAELRLEKSHEKLGK